MVDKLTPRLCLLLLLAVVGPVVVAGDGDVVDVDPVDVDPVDVDPVALAVVEAKEDAKNLPPQDRFIIFDISSNQNLNKGEVNEAFQDLDVEYKFQVYGGKRFVVVVNNTACSLDAFKELSIPKADRIDVFPAEKSGDGFAYFGTEAVQQKEKGFRPFPDKDLIMFELTSKEMGENLEQYKAEMYQMGKAMGDFYEPNYTPRLFHLTTHFPTKWYGFLAVPDNISDREMTEMLKFYGGPFQVLSSITPIFNI